MDDGGTNRGELPDETDVVSRAIDDPSVFSSPIAQFYRAEVDRVPTWRTRLGQTTNWTVVVLAAILTRTFSSADNPHYVLLIGLLAMFGSLFIEEQRYQEYEARRARVLLIQRNLFAELYRSEGAEEFDWREQSRRPPRAPSGSRSGKRSLTGSLACTFTLMTVLLAAWLLRVTVFETGTPWQQSAAIAVVPSRGGRCRERRLSAHARTDGPGDDGRRETRVQRGGPAGER